MSSIRLDDADRSFILCPLCSLAIVVRVCLGLWRPGRGWLAWRASEARALGTISQLVPPVYD